MHFINVFSELFCYSNQILIQQRKKGVLTRTHALNISRFLITHYNFLFFDLLNHLSCCIVLHFYVDRRSVGSLLMYLLHSIENHIEATWTTQVLPIQHISRNSRLILICGIMGIYYSRMYSFCSGLSCSFKNSLLNRWITLTQSNLRYLREGMAVSDLILNWISQVNF
jgi:hypothetical protein